MASINRESTSGTRSGEAKKRQIFYGWIIVAACFIATATLGETIYSFGVFFKPLENEFGWSRSVTSSSYTAFLIGYSISAVGSGKLCDRHGPRLVLLGSAVLAGASIILSGRVSNIDQLRLFLFLAGLGAGATLPVPASTVQRWFLGRHDAKMALSLVMTGVGVGGLIFAPLINHFILTYGWRNAFAILGTLFFIAIFIAGLLMRPSPAGPASRPERPDQPAPVSEWTTRKAMFSGSFISIVYMSCVVILAFQVISVHLIPFATDLGISPTIAAAAAGLMAGFSIPGRIGAGGISMRIGWQKGLALACFGMTAALFLLLFLDTAAMLYVFVIIYGMFMGIRAVAQQGIVADFFGMRSLGELTGIVVAVANIAGAIAPYLAGFIFDTQGSYFIAFAIMTALVFSGGLVMLLTKKPSAKPLAAIPIGLSK